MTRIRIALGALGAVALMATTEASAEWEVKDRNNGQPPVATVRGTTDEVLRVLASRASGAVVGTLLLGRGLAPLAEDGCPSFKVDDKQAGSLADAGRCAISGRSATFVLGELEGDTIKSRALREMMNGKELVLLYRYESHGYSEARFVLNGSAAALTAALGGWKLAR